MKKIIVLLCLLFAVQAFGQARYLGTDTLYIFTDGTSTDTLMLELPLTARTADQTWFGKVWGYMRYDSLKGLPNLLDSTTLKVKEVYHSLDSVGLGGTSGLQAWDLVQINAGADVWTDFDYDTPLIAGGTTGIWRKITIEMGGQPWWAALIQLVHTGEATTPVDSAMFIFHWYQW